LRPADPAWRELFDVLREEGDFAGRRVLDVGCGTGRLAGELAKLGAKVWGVDPSPEMLAEARASVGSKVGLRRASAEALPFRDGWFDRAVMRLVVHLVDRSGALPELARVLTSGGLALIATFRPEHFDDLWLASLFPSLEAIDRARFPDPDLLADELRDAGFSSVARRDLTQRVELSRAEAIERLRGRYISTLLLLPEDEYRAGLERAERELPAVVAYPLARTVLVASR
jgi:SAM-dependent methyltransferase